MLGDVFLQLGELALAQEASEAALAGAPDAKDAWTHRVRLAQIAAKQGAQSRRVTELERLVVDYGESSSWAQRHASDATALRSANDGI